MGVDWQRAVVCSRRAVARESRVLLGYLFLLEYLKYIVCANERSRVYIMLSPAVLALTWWMLSSDHSR